MTNPINNKKATAFLSNNKINIIVYAALSLALILTVCFIFGNSIKSPEKSAEQSQSVVQVIRPIVDPNNQMNEQELTHKVRKSAHFLEFALLGFEATALVLFAKKGFSVNAVVYSLSGCLLVATVDEYIQSFNDRGSSVSDVILDTLGACAGVLLAIAISLTIALIIKRRRSGRADSKEEAPV